MARKQHTQLTAEVKEILQQDGDFLKPMMQRMVQEALEAQMDALLGAGRYERTQGRDGYRSGHYTRSLITRVGKIELRVPQDRQGNFSTELFQRFQRSEKALVSALAEMYVQGVSTRKVTEVTEALCGQSFSASTISRINKQLDAGLEQFATRLLQEDYPYLILDARYERVREDGVIRRQAVHIALGINDEGRRCVLAVELATKESKASWRELLVRLKERGLRGVEYVVSDDHEGLKQAIFETLPQAIWQRCYVHFLRNARGHLPHKHDDDCMTELRWLYDRRNLDEARQDLAAWLSKWQGKYSKLCDWVEANIEETLSYYRLPLAHHKHMKSTNMLERLNQEIKRRTNVLRIFPNGASCLRLVRALAAETHEEWIEGTRYLNMELWREHKREQLKNVEEAA
jgi:transposase-like protein